MLQTYTLFIDEAGQSHFVPHPQYVSLVRRESAAPQFAGQTVRVADFYVHHPGGAAQAHIENETYTSLRLDADGFVHRINADVPPYAGATSSPRDFPAYPAPPVGSTWVPTQGMREHLLTHLQSSLSKGPGHE